MSAKIVLEKQFTRDCGLLVFEMWYEGEHLHCKDSLSYSVKTYVLHSKQGVTEVYYDADELEKETKLIGEKGKDLSFLREVLTNYSQELKDLGQTWKENKPLESREEVISFFDRGARSWLGLLLSYRIPGELTSDEFKRNSDLALGMRKIGEKLFEECDNIFKISLEKLFPDFGTYSRFLSIGEIRTNKIPSMEVLKERERKFVYHNGNILTGKKWDNFLEDNNLSVKKIDTKEIKEFKGQVAFTGKVSGKVRKIMKRSEIGSIKEGEILVTSMTTPDFLPAMKKSSAFITDEGGITCHAAIVAREMKKPCVIGTKIATQVLKDGDYVEVNANQGVVRILGKAKT